MASSLDTAVANEHAGRSALAVALAVLMSLAPQPVAADEPQPIVYFHPAASIVPAKSYGPSFPAIEEPVMESDGGMNGLVKQSIGGLIGGTLGSGVALLAGGENLVNIIAGGLVSPQNPVVLYTGLFGVVFASFCAIGQAMTPLYLYYFDNVPPVEVPPPEMVAPPSARTGIPIRFD